MPQRYQGHTLPAFLYAYPGEAAAAAGMIAAGVVLAAPPYQLVNAVGDDLWWLGIVFGIVHIIAASLTLTGLAGWKRSWHTGVEQVGLWLTSGVMAVDLILLIAAQNPAAWTYPGIMIVAVALGSIIRARAIRIDLTRRLSQITTVNELREETAKHGTLDVGPAQNPGPPPAGR